MAGKIPQIGGDGGGAAVQIIDALDSTSAVAALSANQGRVLAGMIAAGGGVPAGAVAHFARSTAPDGWLKANGAAVSVSTYAALASAIYCGDANNATAGWGYRCTDAANPSTTRSTTGGYIVLPDGRGEFLRGLDDARGADSGRSLWASQADQLKSHTHSALVNGASGAGTTGGYFAPGTGTTTWQHGVTVGSTGGTETRPRNIALLACIKY